MATSKKPIDDVAKPGDTPADATSRPLIVSSGAMMKDPMVTDDSKAKTDEPSSLQTSPKKVVEPLAEADSDPVDAEVKPDNADATKEDTPKPEKADEKAKSDAKAEAKSTEPTDSEQADDTAVVDAVVDQVADNKQVSEEDKAAEERQKVVDQLTEQKKYFVPLAAAQHRRNNKIAVIVICALVPLIVGVILAIDAGVIDLGFDLPFDIIPS